MPESIAISPSPATNSHGAPLRVLLVSSSSGSKGGGEIYLVELATGLLAVGLDVVVLLSDHQRMDGLAAMFPPGVQVDRIGYTNTYDRRLRCGGAVLAGQDIKALARIFHRWQPDVLHLNKQNLEDGLDLLLAAKRSGLPTVTTVHVTRTMTDLRAVAGPLRDRLSHRTLARSNSDLLAIAARGAQDLREQLAGRVAADRIHCVTNGVSPAPGGNRKSTRAEWGVTDRDVVLGCVARIEAQKNPLFMLSVLAKLPAHVHLAWIGDGRLRAAFEAEAARLNVTHRVHLDGWRTDARARMAGFDLFVLPSEYEGLPLAILEAMAAGLPCVASDVDGVREAIVDGETGALCRYNDAQDWEQCLRTLAEDVELRKQLSQAAQARYKAYFSLEAMASGTLAVYRQILSRVSSPASALGAER